MVMNLPMIENRSILTPTSGFLAAGYTHTINPYQGCAFAGSLCGEYCYAQHNHYVTKGRPWRLYGAKRNIREAYRRDYDALKRPQRSLVKPLRVYMASSTDPYVPQEQRLCLTLALLQEMLKRPPDVLVIQTRNPLVGRDLEIIAQLAERCELWLSMTVETDWERIPGLSNHATPIRKRLATLKAFQARCVATQATVSPMLPMLDPVEFAHALERVCTRVILDHYLLGDGSPGGLRTKRTLFPSQLEAVGLGAWNRLEKFWEIKTIFDAVLGPERVLVSAAGFNAVGPTRLASVNDSVDVGIPFRR